LKSARRLLATHHQQLGEHEYAIEHGKIYLRENPDESRVRILVAQSLVSIGKDEEAFEVLAAIPEDQYDANSLFAIGRLHERRGDAKKAREFLTRANAELPNNDEILAALLAMDRADGKLDEAVARIEAASAAAGDDADLIMLQGSAYAMQGEQAARDGDREAAQAALDKAEAAFKKATEVAPDNLEAYQQLGNFYRATGRVDESIASYEKAIAAGQAAPAIHHLLAVMYEFRGDSPKAIEHYEAAIAGNTGMGEARNNLAYLLAQSDGDLDRALDLAQQAKGLMPDSPNAADTLGWVLFKRGVPSAAIGYLREAEAGMDPGSPALGVVRFHLAQAYEAAGEHDKAIESLDRAIEDLDARIEQVRAQGGEPSEPGWATDVRAMRQKLASNPTG